MRWITCIAGLALLLAPATFAELSPHDLVQNGRFEPDLAHWQFLVHGASATGQLDDAERHQGHHSFRMSNASGQAPHVYARLVQVITGMQPFTTYQVTCWAKGKGCGVNWIGGGPGWLTRTAFPVGDFDWREVSFEINTGVDPDNYELMVATESQTTALWIADIRFEVEKVDQAKQGAAETNLNLTLADFNRRIRQWTNTDNAYLRLGRTVAQRFINYAHGAGSNRQMSLGWISVQMDEVAQVLDEVDKIAQTNSPVLNWFPPRIGAVKLKDGTFYSAGRPFYFYGYGHFDSVFEDLPNFPALGASLVQDGRIGPTSMKEDGTLDNGALEVLKGLDRASQFGMREDFLLSPHYYPTWAQAADVPNANIGFLRYNIFHPKAKAAIDQWAGVIGERIKNKPALHSVCLANEPVYNSSGRDPYSRPMFSEFLMAKHKSIEHLNALYGTKYTNFDEVIVPPDAMPADVLAQRAYYDWTCFNKKMFADWHGHLDSVLKSHGVKVPTHTKIMVFQTLDRNKQGWGVDPELICHATDLAGCDAYAFVTPGAYTYNWIGHEFYYDLLHSFRGQSVFNSENHLIPDNSPRAHIPMNHSRSVIWQDGLHHQGSTTIWVWQMTGEDTGGTGLGGSIYFRPANIFGAGRAMLDLNRLSPEVTAINNARPRVALLYSQPSVFWEEKYKSTMISLYTALNFMGEPITFISERELASGAAPKIDWLIIPNATHVLDSTPAALIAYKKAGGTLLLVGEGCLSRNEYDQPLISNPSELPSLSLGADDRATAAALRNLMQLPNATDLRQNLDGLPAWGVEFRTVPFGRYILMPMDNFNPDLRKVTLPKWEGHLAIDLLSGEYVDVKSINLEPMLPRLLRINR